MFLSSLSVEFYLPVAAKEFAHTIPFYRTASRDNRKQLFLYPSIPTKDLHFCGSICLPEL
jgi:hypothetical protein